MKYICEECAEMFTAAKKPKCCPFCLSENIRGDGKSRQTALALIERSNQLTTQLMSLWKNISRYTLKENVH